jgi:microsomal prostaglandin-E synthase 2
MAVLLRQNRRFLALGGASAAFAFMFPWGRSFSAAASAVSAVPRAGAHLQTGLPVPGLQTGLPPPLPPTRLHVILYQYEACPFCNKVRAYLDAQRVPYTVVEVEPMFKAQLAWQDYKKVPLAVVNGRAVADSNAIIDVVERLSLFPSPPSPPTAHELAWRAWTDDTLIKVLTVNLYRSFGDALQTFDYLTLRNFSPYLALPAKYFGAVAMTLVARKRRAALGVAAGGERAALRGALEELERGMGGAPFLGGAAPSRSDVAAFGALRSVAALPVHAAAMEHAPTAAWWARMQAHVGVSQLQHRVSEPLA